MCIRDSVHMLGHIDNPYPIFKQADVYVCSSRHESFSLTVAESLILERPTISTKCTGPIELLENGKYGILVAADEIELKKAIELMVSNYEEREYYSKRAKERIESVSYTHLDVYKRQVYTVSRDIIFSFLYY